MSQKNISTIELNINGVDVDAVVEFDFHKGQSPILNLRPEDCHEELPDEYELTSVFIKDAGDLHQADFLIDLIGHKIVEILSDMTVGFDE